MNVLRLSVVFALVLSGQAALGDPSASSNAEAAAAAIAQQVNKVGNNPDSQPPSARDAIYEAFKRQR